MNLITLTDKTIERRKQRYQPIIDFLVTVVKINEADLQTTFYSSESWFNDSAISITLPELLKLYELGRSSEREKCAKIADKISDKICHEKEYMEYTPLGIAEEIADCIRELECTEDL